MLKATIFSMKSLFFSMSLLFIGSSLMIASGAVIMRGNGVSEFVVGLVTSFYFLGALISTITSHKIISRVGHIRSFGAFTSIYAFATILHLAGNDPIFWAILRFSIGYCYYGLLMIIESWINEKSSNEIRGRVLSVYEIIFYLSSGIGVLILWLNLSPENIFHISIALLMVCAIPLNLMRIKEPSLPPKIKISIPKVFNISTLAIICAFSGGILMNGFNSMGGIFILLLGHEVNSVGVFIFFGMIGGFIGQSLVGGISDKYGRKIMICLSSLIALISCVILLIATAFNSIYFLYISACLFGLGAFCLYALGLARANDKSKSISDTLEIGRALLFSYSLGSFCSPIILGFMMNFFGANGFIFTFLIVLLVVSVYAFTQPIIPINKRKEYKKHMSIMVDEKD